MYATLTAASPAYPRVFVSHAHEPDDATRIDHENFIKTLAGALVYSEVDLIVDLYDLGPAENLVSFMQNGVQQSDRVICVCTRRYVERMNYPKGGVGAEWRFIAQEIERNQNTNKFIPVFHRNEGAGRPAILGINLFIDFDARRFSDALDDLVRAIHGDPRTVKPRRPRRWKSDEDLRAIEALDPALSTAALLGGSFTGSFAVSAFDRFFRRSADAPKIQPDADFIEARSELRRLGQEVAYLVKAREDQARELGLKEALLVQLARNYATPEAQDFYTALDGLTNALETARQQRTRGTPSSTNGDSNDSILAEVDAFNEVGDFDVAAAKLESELATLAMKQREESAARLAEDQEHAARVLQLREEAITQAVLTRDVGAAARHSLAILNEAKTRFGPEGFEALRDLHISWYKRGRDNGVNFDLQVSIKLAKVSWEVATNPNQKGTALNDLGEALRTLGEREDDAESLNEAVAAFREALNERPRDRVPIDWAQTQDGLGNALRALGERESDTVSLTQAVAVYHKALEVRTRDRAPRSWAATQNNLGNALSILGYRELNTARVTEAVHAYREALKERTRDRDARAWAMTQNNLGNALLNLGRLETGTIRLTEAVEAYRDALNERTRERLPLSWAMTQHNLGEALKTLGEREDNTGRLAQAFDAYREALRERTRDRIPLDWARTRESMAEAHQIEAKLLFEDDARRALDQALAAVDDALTVFTTDHTPFQHRRASQLRTDIVSAIEASDG